MHEHEFTRLLECLETALQQLARLELKNERLVLLLLEHNRMQTELLRRILAGQRHYPRPVGGVVTVS